MNDNGKQRSFMDRPFFQYFLAPLVVALISIFVTRYLTQRDAVQKLSDGTNGIVNEGDTIGDAADRINALQEELNQKEQLVEKLEEQLNDNSEIKKLNGQIEDKQNEVDKLQKDIDNLQKDKEKLQADFDELLQKKYEEYMKERESLPVSLGSLEPMKNDGINTKNAGDISVDKTKFAYYIDSGSSGESFAEYDLNNEYSRFEGKAYISDWAYRRFNSDSDKISNASISIQIKLQGSDTYQEIDSISGLTADSEPVNIGGSLIGATRLKIVIRGGHYNGGVNGDGGTIIRLGEPVLYKNTQ